jgi:hypothetical protein
VFFKYWCRIRWKEKIMSLFGHDQLQMLQAIKIAQGHSLRASALIDTGMVANAIEQARYILERRGYIDSYCPPCTPTPHRTAAEEVLAILRHGHEYDVGFVHVAWPPKDRDRDTADKLRFLVRLRTLLLNILLLRVKLTSNSRSIFLSEERFFEYHGTGRPPKSNQVLSVDLVPAF